MDKKNSLYKDINYSNKSNTIQKSLGISKYIENMSSMHSSIYNLGLADSGLKHISSMQKSLGISKYIENMSSMHSSIYNLGLADSGLKHISSMQKSLGISKYIENMSSMHSSIYNLVLADSGLKYISSMQKLLGINKTIKDVSKLQNLLEKQKVLREKYLNELNNENININNDGSISVESGVITKEEMQNKIYECMENLSYESDSYDNFEVKLEFVVNKLKGISPELKKILKWIMCSIVLPIILGLSTNILYSKYERSSDKFVVKNIKKELKYENFDNQTLKKYRIVSYNGLIIKSDCSMKSNTISKLDVGKVVKILYKNKNWTLIEWECEDRNTNTGWTLTRYLARIKK